MPKYEVNFQMVGSITIYVDAENEADAIEQAYEELPSPNIHWDFDPGEWTLPSELFPQFSKAEDDVREVN